MTGPLTPPLLPQVFVPIRVEGTISRAGLGTLLVPEIAQIEPCCGSFCTLPINVGRKEVILLAGRSTIYSVVLSVHRARIAHRAVASLQACLINCQHLPHKLDIDGWYPGDWIGDWQFMRFSVFVSTPVCCLRLPYPLNLWFCETCEPNKS